MCAVGKGVAVVRPEWVIDSDREGRKLPCEDYALPPFEGLRITLTGLSPGETIFRIFCVGVGVGVRGRVRGRGFGGGGGGVGVGVGVGVDDVHVFCASLQDSCVPPLHGSCCIITLRTNRTRRMGLYRARRFCSTRKPRVVLRTIHFPFLWLFFNPVFSVLIECVPPRVCTFVLRVLFSAVYV